MRIIPRTVAFLAFAFAYNLLFITNSLASVLVDDGEGQIVWVEDFSGSVDAGAGRGPELDSTEIVDGKLLQKLGGLSEITVDFTDAARFSYDPARLEITGGVAALRRDGISIYPDFYWRFEDSAWDGSDGEVLSSAGSGGHGSSRGATLLADGFLGQAASFDGASWLEFGQNSGLDFKPDQDDLTLAAWFRTTGDGALMGKAVTSSAQRQVYLFLLNGRLSANMGGVQRSGATAGLTDGQWHHAAMVNFDAPSASPSMSTACWTVSSLQEQPRIPPLS